MCATGNETGTVETCLTHSDLFVGTTDRRCLTGRATSQAVELQMNTIESLVNYIKKSSKRSILGRK